MNAHSRIMRDNNNAQTNPMPITAMGDSTAAFAAREYSFEDASDFELIVLQPKRPVAVIKSSRAVPEVTIRV